MDAKDLYKKLSKGKSSEVLFELPEQPENTCPMIDSTISDINSFLAEMNESSLLIKELITNEENDFNSQGLETISSISFLMDDYKKLLRLLEILRTDLTKLRDTSKNHKEKLWNSISNAISISEDGTYQKTGKIHNVNTNKGRDVQTDEISELISDIIESHNIAWNELDLDEPLFSQQELIMESLSKIKTSFLSNKPTDELINAIYLNEWVEEVLRKSSQEVFDLFISFIENNGYQES